MQNKINFFGLLHFKKNENLNLNFRSKSEKDKILVYLKNAIVLNEQLKNLGYNFELITNDRKYLNNLLNELNFSLKLREINFNTFVPSNTHFYSCHFRVDIFRYLSSLKNSYSALIDLDVLILKKPINLEKKKNTEIAFVNEITNNVVPAYGKKNILRKLNILEPNIKTVRWYGGDFFCGNSSFYTLLYKKSKLYQKKFVKNLCELKNQTDELFISLAIQDIKKKYKVLNCEKYKIFTRYWNTNIKHKQRSFSYYINFPLLHIPADKIFLSKCFNNINFKKNFKNEYYARVNNIINYLKLNLIKILPMNIKKILKGVK